MSNPNLRGIFMKTGNKIGGQYFAELMHIVFARLRSATHDGAKNAFSTAIFILKRSSYQDRLGTNIV